MSRHIEPFQIEHLPRAKELATEEWRRKSAFLPALKAMEGERNLEPMLYNALDKGIGFTLWEEETMVGYLLALASPYKTKEGKPKWYSPLGANSFPSVGSDVLLASLLNQLPEGEITITRFLSGPLEESTLLHYGFVPDRVDALKLLHGEENHQTESTLHFFELPLSEQEAIRPHRKALEQFLASPPIFRHTSEEESETWFRDKGKRIFVAEREKETVGFFALTKNGRNYLSSCFWSSYGLYVDPTLRGEGIGQQLVAFVSETLSSEGECYLGTDYNRANRGAVSFWSKAFIPYAVDYRKDK